MTSEQLWMQHAYSLAERARDLGEIPIGACLVAADGMTLLGEGFNQMIAHHDATAHAEIQALRGAGMHVGNHRLPGTTLYVTLEPCLMCYGALMQARVGAVVFACRDPKLGVFSQHGGGHAWGDFNHQMVWREGVMHDACQALLQTFFKQKRCRS